MRQEETTQQVGLETNLYLLNATAGITLNKLPLGWTSPVTETKDKEVRRYAAQVDEIKAHSKEKSLNCGPAGCEALLPLGQVIDLEIALAK